MALKRNPTPAGSITHLFDRLHELHLDAGEPGVREIATGIGRGVLSYTTVHNVFRGPKVPRWGHLELIVEQLGGDVEEFRSLWKAARLAELALPGPLEPERGIAPADEISPATGSQRVEGSRSGFVMVTYRLPIQHETDNLAGGRWNLRMIGPGAALSELVKARDGVWVGWSGQPGVATSSITWDGMSLKSVELSSREVEMHRDGYCNSTIWPLYHDSIERPEFRTDWRTANRAVNQRFADAVARIAAPGAKVWVHDYQLQLVPGLLREQRPDIRTGFFLHVPLPSVELFTRLPGRVETLRGLLGADLVGFQHPRSAQNFVRLCAEVLGLASEAHSVSVDGRRVTVGAFPISIDVAAIERLVDQPPIVRRAEQIRTEIGSPETLLVGLDRLDYTKGIEQKLLAYGEILEDGRLPADSLAFIQAATLSREKLARYEQLRERVDRVTGRLNGSYGRVGRPVVHYVNRVLTFDEVVALYLAADVMVVTPLRDGMNLVAKEYVASRANNRGVLVLSEFAGAAAEFSEALLVNPNDPDDLKHAMLRAVAMTPEEQAQRMDTMRRHLRKHDAHAWIEAFLTGLDKAAPA